MVSRTGPIPVRRAILAGVAFALVAAVALMNPQPRRDGLGLFDDPVVQMQLSGIGLDEISGLCFSRAHAGHIWVHQDDIGDPRIYRFGADGTHQQTVGITGLSVDDWEDMALGPLPDGSPHGIFIGDIGDGGSSPDVFRIVVIDERDTLLSNQVAPVRVVEATWPGDSFDCESLMVSPVTGDIFLLSRGSGGISHMFRIAFDQWSGGSGSPTVEFVGFFNLSALGTEDGLLDAYEVTGADFDPAMSSLALRTKQFVYLYALDGEPSAALFDSSPFAVLSTSAEPQGEAVTFGLDGRDLFTASEGSSLVLRFARRDPPGDGVSMR